MSQPKPPTIGSLIDLLHGMKAAKKALEGQIKELDKQADRLELQIIERMDTEETSTGSGKAAGASINESVVPQVQDWDAFYKFIHENKWYHLLQRRPSSPGCRELFEQQKQIDGVVPFTKRTLNLRSL